MKRIFVVTALMLFAFIGTQAQSLDDVLKKHYAATGQEKIAAVKTFYVKAKMSMMGMDLPMTIQMKKPDKFRIEMEVMGQKIIQAYDGKAGWAQNPMAGAGITELKGPELQQAMNQADMEGELYNYAKKGHSAELIGKVNADGKEAYKIKLTNADGTVKDYFIDADSYLVSKVKATVESMGQSVDVETKVSEYKDINGIKMGSKMEVSTPMGAQTLLMEEIKLDETIDDSIFVRPSE
ncbi:outer membrane lipoprotein-sorting protein [Maribellus sp. YY47]|uniref:LolA family protein n=1 Tax=Maribellus sp. YY47 TaxID=2929486 RepID=UPI00200064EE|nr:outer membrane lipoprotein-sorting protein [Maribellus sp. YY47]MCK3683499.1 outer membrane lipoprotein-sorting protein [Maribellus sp. YY47]